jgi:hypothetical protein
LNLNVKAFGFGGSEAFEKASGEHSSVRFEAGTPISFLTRGYIGNIDPSQIYEIVRLKPHGRDRIIPMIRAGLSMRGQTINPQLVQFDGSQVSGNFYQITPNTKLEPGEYIVRKASAEEGYFFGVDPTK